MVWAVKIWLPSFFVPSELVVILRCRKDVNIAVAIQVRGMHALGTVGIADNVRAIKFSVPLFSYQRIRSSFSDAERTSTSPSPSTSVAYTLRRRPPRY